MERPIGVIDSGLGGLTVAKEISRQLPKERMVYIGDTARCPYGPRPVEEVRAFTWEMIDRLLEEDIKMLIIACNTATAVVLEEVKEALTIPVIGVVQPGAITALKVTENNHVAVIGTAGTIASGAYIEALHTINANVKVDSLSCPPFVPLVENGFKEKEKAIEVITNTLQPLLSSSFDTMILGCTHYPLLQELIQEVVGEHISLISSGDETAREVSTILHYNNDLALEEALEENIYYTTGAAESFKEMAEEWLQHEELAVYSIQLSKTSVQK